jgi:four helix bundle protein
MRWPRWNPPSEVHSVEFHGVKKLGGQATSREGVEDMSEDRWKKLEIWKLADSLAYDIYLATRDFPKEETFGITSQLRRAALSVPTNIVEGYSRKGDKELSRFISISLGSFAETKYLLHFARRLGYLSHKQYESLEAACEILGKKLWRFCEKVQ